MRRRESTPKEARLPFRLVHLFLSLTLSLSAADPSIVTGVVADASGRPLPRAHVEVVTDDGGVSTFTAIDGTFSLSVARTETCRVVASMSGFATAEEPCGDRPLTLTLAVAPVAEQIVVSATRTEAPTGQIAGGATVFDSDALDLRQRPLAADLLRDAPGTTIVRSGAPGGVTSMFTRGGESNYTKVLLDGIPLNEPGGAFDFSTLTTDGLARIEYVRGANSALFGSDAMAGVVQLFTERGRSATPQVTLFAEGGSFSTGRGGASIAGRAGRADYAASIDRLSTKNQVVNDAFADTTVSGSAGVTLAPGATLRFVGRLQRGRTGVPGQTAFGRADSDAFFAGHDGVWGVTFDAAGTRVRQRASYGLSTSRQQSADFVVDPTYTPAYDGHVSPFPFDDYLYDSRVRLRRHHASYQADLTTPTRGAGTHVDTALVDWDGERGTLTDAMAGSSTVASRDNVGVSLQHQALWSRAFATVGIRFEHNASFGNAAVPRASVAWYVRPGTGRFGATKLSASAGLGIKEPTILQSFSPSPYYLGNPDLQPERARTADVSLEQRLLHDRVKLEATYFDNRYRNIIALRTIDFVTFNAQYFNIGLTRARGAELSGDVALVSGLRARAGYTFTASRILESTSPDNPVFEAGTSAFRRPRNSGFAELSWTAGRLNAAAYGTFVGGRADSDLLGLEPPLLWNAGYTTWDLRASGRIDPKLSLTFAVDNLANARYMEPLGYPALGRAIRAGIRATF